MYLNLIMIFLGCRYEPLPGPEDERQLLGHVLEMYRSKVLPKGLEHLSEDKVRACCCRM